MVTGEKSPISTTRARKRFGRLKHFVIFTSRGREVTSTVSYRSRLAVGLSIIAVKTVVSVASL